MGVTLWCSLSTCWTADQWLTYWLALAAGLGLIFTALRAPDKRKHDAGARRRLFHLRRPKPHA
jgi:hypothetical protein